MLIVVVYFTTNNRNTTPHRRDRIVSQSNELKQLNLALICYSSELIFGATIVQKFIVYFVPIHWDNIEVKYC